MTQAAEMAKGKRVQAKIENICPRIRVRETAAKLTAVFDC